MLRSVAGSMDRQELDCMSELVHIPAFISIVHYVFNKKKTNAGIRMSEYSFIVTSSYPTN